MPTYSYRCTSCNNEFDIRQSFHDDPLTICDDCGGQLRKLFNSVGVVFKGSGFYHTDSKSKASLGAKQSTGTQTEASTSPASSSTSESSSTSSNTSTSE